METQDFVVAEQSQRRCYLALVTLRSPPDRNNEVEIKQPTIDHTVRLGKLGNGQGSACPEVTAGVVSGQTRRIELHVIASYLYIKVKLKATRNAELSIRSNMQTRIRTLYANAAASISLRSSQNA